jgi:hypothetical protein
MPRRKITTAWLPGAMSIVIWTTIALLQFLASRGRKGYGPARIRQELNQKGLPGSPSKSDARMRYRLGELAKSRRA